MIEDTLIGVGLGLAGFAVLYAIVECCIPGGNDMNDDRNAADEGVDRSIPPQARYQSDSEGSRIVAPGAPSVQSLGITDVKDLSLCAGDEVSAVPLPCGITLIVHRRGSSVRIGTSPFGPRLPCTPDDVVSLAERVEKLAARMDRAMAHPATNAVDHRQLRREIDDLRDHCRDTEAWSAQVDARLLTIERAHPELVRDEGMGVVEPRDGEVLPDAGRKGVGSEVRAEVRDEESNGVGR